MHELSEQRKNEGEVVKSKNQVGKEGTKARKG